jgi:hypothetical protein
MMLTRKGQCKEWEEIIRIGMYICLGYRYRSPGVNCTETSLKIGTGGSRRANCFPRKQ